ncbi:MAG TPA: zeta toxin family protein, partial [Acidimicrobiales bacterium]|nr:zeta toxin family protein [Acidimicrobiales bacterium]
IARQRWPEAPEIHSYEAADIAAATRSRLIELRRPLIAETVFSHPSKLDLMDEARGGGYYIALHVILVPVDLAVARVAYRHAAGGHDVPEEKIRGRYERLWELVAVAVGKADAATFWDNTGIHEPLQVAAFIGGLAVRSPTWPAWGPAALTSRWPA